MSIIDCHTHLNNYNEINKTEGKVLSLDGRFKALLESMNNNDVGYSLILSSYVVDEDRPSTSHLVDLVKNKDKNNRIGIVAGFTIDNHTDEDLKNYREWLRDGVIKGIKLYCGYEHHYPYDERYQKIYDMCIEFDYPIMVHTGDSFSPKSKVKYAHPLNIDDVAVDNPELKIIMCHIGNPWIVDCQEVIYKNRNVYADISGLIVGDFTLSAQDHYVNKIRELLHYIGEPHRLLYGSDWPICNMSSYLKFTQNLQLDKESFELLMFKNAQKLFKI